MTPSTPLLSAELWVDYPQRKGVLAGARLEVLPGEMLGLLGQSGSGKSTFSMAVLGLLRSARAAIRGSVVLNGHELIAAPERKMRELRGRVVSLVPQSPLLALNPALRIGTQLREAWIAHGRHSWKQQIDLVRGNLVQAGLPGDDSFLERFPRQISVGQAQRVLIVMALMHAPALLIADEPTSALDMITQREILDLIRRINVERRMSVLFISHDLLSVASICDRIAILHEGSIVECGPVREVMDSPRHPFARKLISSLPR